jgi:hypothetical protein
MSETYNCKNYFEQPDINDDNKAHFEGTSVYNNVEFTAEEIESVLSANPSPMIAYYNQIVTRYSLTGASILATGKAVLIGGTGQTMNLQTPVEGCLADLNLLSITSGTVTILCPTGVTFDGTHNAATFDAAGDHLVVGYKSATEWEIFQNSGVVLSVI